MIQITPMNAVLNLLSVKVLETQGRMETSQTGVQCGSHGLIMRSLWRERQKTANMTNFTKNLGKFWSHYTKSHYP